MNNKINLNEADRVIIPKSEANLIQHHAIYAGYDAHGIHWFLENHYSSGVRYINSHDLFNNTPFDRIRVQKFIGNELQRQYAINRAKQMLGRRYNLLSYNCEHYSNDVQLGSSESSQVMAGLFITGIIACTIGIIADIRYM